MKAKDVEAQLAYFAALDPTTRTALLAVAQLGGGAVAVEIDRGEIRRPKYVLFTATGIVAKVEL